MKKKILSLLLIMMLIISLFVFTACGDKEEIEENNDEIETLDTLSESEAERLLKEYYEYAYNLYCTRDLFEKSSDVNSDDMYEIFNFEEVTQKYMTEDAIEDLIENAPLLVKENNNYYVLLGGISEEYDNLEFKDIEIEPNKIKSTVVLDVIVGDEVIKKNVCAEFSLEKIDDNWLIDEYTYYASMEDRYNGEADEEDLNETAILELKAALNNNTWLKENVYMKKDCFSGEISSSVQQILTFSVAQIDGEYPIVFVQAESDEVISKQVFIVRYSDKDGVYVESLTKSSVHQSHEGFKTDGNVIIEEYGHMGYCSYDIYEVTNSTINKIDSIEPIESNDYHELDEAESKYDFEYIENELNSTNIDEYLQ